MENKNNEELIKELKKQIELKDEALKKATNPKTMLFAFLDRIKKEYIQFIDNIIYREKKMKTMQKENDLILKETKKKDELLEQKNAIIQVLSAENDEYKKKEQKSCDEIQKFLPQDKKDAINLYFKDIKDEDLVDLLPFMQNKETSNISIDQLENVNSDEPPKTVHETDNDIMSSSSPSKYEDNESEKQKTYPNIMTNHTESSLQPDKPLKPNPNPQPPKNSSKPTSKKANAGSSKQQQPQKTKNGSKKNKQKSTEPYNQSKVKTQNSDNDTQNKNTANTTHTHQTPAEHQAQNPSKQQNINETQIKEPQLNNTDFENIIDMTDMVDMADMIAVIDDIDKNDLPSLDIDDNIFDSWDDDDID